MVQMYRKTSYSYIATTDVISLSHVKIYKIVDKIVS